MECENDNPEALQMPSPYALGGTIWRKCGLNSLIRYRFGYIANLEAKHQV
jgi:hypothetical protein